jgi:hypothetical protein
MRRPLLRLAQQQRLQLLPVFCLQRRRPQPLVL